MKNKKVDAAVSMFDMIQSAEFVEIICRTKLGTPVRLYLTELGIIVDDLPKDEAPNYVMLQAAITVSQILPIKYPLSAEAVINLTYLRDVYEKNSLRRALMGALQSAKGMEDLIVDSIEFYSADIVALEYETMLQKQYVLTYRQENGNNLVLVGGVYGELELRALEEGDFKYPIQAYRFAELTTDINTIINDNMYVKSMMNAKDNPEKPSYMRNRANWSVQVIKTYTKRIATTAYGEHNKT